MAALALLALLVLAPAPGAEAQTRPLRDALGVMVDGPMLDGTVDLDGEARRIDAIGFGHVRLGIYWSDVERWPGRPQEWAKYDRLIGAFARRGVHVLPVLLRAPLWATGGVFDEGAVPDNDAFGRFAASAVARYGRTGAFWRENPQIPGTPITDWQIWNEPHFPAQWKIQPEFAPSYVAMVRAARTAIKGVDPQARIVLGGLSGAPWWELERIYRAGGKGTFDVVAIHPYRDTPGLVIQAARATRRMMNRFGDGQMPIMITEVTRSSSQGYVEDHPLYGDETDQAVWLTQLLSKFERYRHALGIERMFWFTWMSPPVGGDLIWEYAGLRRRESDGRVVDKPALGAMRIAVKAWKRRVAAQQSAERAARKRAAAKKDRRVSGSAAG